MSVEWLLGIIGVVFMGWQGWLSLLALKNQKSIIALEAQVTSIVAFHDRCKFERVQEARQLLDKVSANFETNANAHQSIVQSLGRVEGKVDLLVRNGK